MLFLESVQQSYFMEKEDGGSPLTILLTILARPVPFYGDVNQFIESNLMRDGAV